MIQNKITFKKGRPYADRRKDMDVWYAYVDGKKIGNSKKYTMFIYKIYDYDVYMIYHVNDEIIYSKHETMNDAKNAVVKSINANPKNYFQKV